MGTDACVGGPRALNRDMRGDELLALLRREAEGGRAVAAMMRHAARHPIADPKLPHLAELTSEGCSAAEEFGARLGGFARLRLFHSPVNRCKQTAECIAQGAGRAGVPERSGAGVRSDCSRNDSARSRLGGSPLRRFDPRRPSRRP